MNKEGEKKAKEYSCIQYQIKDISNIKTFKRKPTKSVKQDYSKYNCVTRMIHTINYTIQNNKRK